MVAGPAPSSLRRDCDDLQSADRPQTLGYGLTDSPVGYRDVQNKTPTAVAVFPQDYRTIKAFAARANNLVRYTEFDRGGHFAYTTDPNLVVDDLREFFDGLD